MDNTIIFDEFYKLLNNYTNIFYKNLLPKYNNKPEYFEYIYLKGLFLLKNIFILLLFYNDNTNEVILISEKAYIYYIEFLIQINLNILNLELSLNDAIIFTYKKTILNYNTKLYNNIYNFSINDDKSLSILCNLFYIINNLIICTNNDLDDNSINLLVKKKLSSIEKIHKKIKSLLNNNLNKLDDILLNFRDNIEKINLNQPNNNIQTNNTIFNKIVYLLDNYHNEKELVKSKSFCKLFNE